MNTKTDAALDDNGEEAYSDVNKDVLDRMSRRTIGLHIHLANAREIQIRYRPDSARY